jgi:hypothetical protein
VQCLSVSIVELGEVAVMVQVRGIFEIVSRFEDIQDREECFLEEKNCDLDAVPDEVEGS